MRNDDTNRKRDIPPLRRYRRRTCWLALVIVVLVIVFLALIFREPEPEPVLAPSQPIHLITMEPQATPEPTPTRYPVPLDGNLQDWIEVQCGDDVDPAMVYAIIAVETGGTWDPESLGDNGDSYGLMQVNKQYSEDRMKKLGCWDLFDPMQNTVIGIDILRELIADGKSDSWVIMAYNGWKPYADGMENRGDLSVYAKKVLLLQRIYQEAVL